MFQQGQMGIYIHWPFCVSKCPYCDFNVYLNNKHESKVWRDAYLHSIKTYKNLMPDREVVSIYFGGGTPSLMAPELAGDIITAIRESWPCADNIEITLEANPTSAEIDKFKAFSEAGVNRLSLGVQSLRDDVLKFLGRLHGSDEVLRAINIANGVFHRFTFDLIYALPNQTLQEWERDLKAAIPMMKGHLSAYQLTVKGGTAFEKQEARGDFTLPDSDKAADFYNLTNDIMADHDMPAYEVSNYGASGQESRHNLVYWHYQDYIGIGPGAHGRITINGNKYATQDYKKPEDWLRAVNENGKGCEVFDELSVQDRLEEILMGGLRIKEGIDLQKLGGQTGLNPQEKLDWEHIEIACAQGWLDYREGRYLIPSREGWLRCDSLLPYILKV
ncbi:MAG: radical SAM family heme chaperone HemW [Alphaproteobacteria bacterium]